MKLKTVATLLLVPVVALVDWESFLLFDWWRAVWLGIPVAGVLALLGARIKRWRIGAVAGFALLASGVVGGGLALVLNRVQVAGNTALGDQIAVALGKHWAAHASYPGSLSQLVPEFLSAVPTPSLGLLRSTSYLYTSSDREGEFALGYPASSSLAVMRIGGEWSAVPLRVGPL